MLGFLRSTASFAERNSARQARAAGTLRLAAASSTSSRSSTMLQTMRSAAFRKAAAYKEAPRRTIQDPHLCICHKVAA